MKRFDIVQELIILAGKIQARRVAKAQAKVKALKAAIDAACKALPDAQKEVSELAGKAERITY